MAPSGEEGVASETLSNISGAASSNNEKTPWLKLNEPCSRPPLADDDRGMYYRTQHIEDKYERKYSSQTSELWTNVHAQSSNHVSHSGSSTA